MESKLDLLSREEKFQLLDQLVRNGIEELCKFAKQHKFLEPPFGKTSDPTPLISEEDFIKSGALQCDDKESEFRYEYGFDPVKFLGQYLVWAHPDSVETRRKKKEDALNRLRFRVTHARKQLQTEELLVQRVKNFRSGIMWGPLALVVGPTAVRLSLRTFRPSTVLLQIAVDANFTKDIRMFRLEAQANAKTNNDKSESLKKNEKFNFDENNSNVFACYVDVEQLRGRQVYHCRAIAVSKIELTNGTIILPAQDSDFWDYSTQQTESKNNTFHISPSEALYSIFSTATVETLDIAQTQPNINTFDENNNDDNDHSKKGKKFLSRPTSRSTSREIDEDTEAAAMREKVMTLRCLGQLPVENALFTSPALPSSTLQHPSSLKTSSSGGDDNSILETVTDGRNNDNERTPDFTAVLSDAFWHKDADYFCSHNLTVLSSSDYGKQLSSILQRLFYVLSAGRPASQDISSNTNNTSLLWAYRDAHPRAMATLREEELAFKQHRHDLKKYNKKYDLDTGVSNKNNNNSNRSKLSSQSKINTNNSKDTIVAKDIPPPPQLKLPDLSPQLEALLQQLPIPLSMVSPPAATAKDEKNAKKPLLKKKGDVSDPVVVLEPLIPTPLAPRMLYRAVSLSADVLAIILDLRRTPDQHSMQINAPGCDYLGCEQADWLARILRKSTALWKIILCAKTFGACLVREEKLDIVENNGDGFFIGNEVLKGCGSKPGATDSANYRSRTPTASEMDNNATTVTSTAPVVGVLKRQPSTSGSQARFVQVLEPEKDESKLLEPVYDEVDEVFGRSKCSLQYVLARYQEKFAEEKMKDDANTAVLPPPLFPEVQRVGGKGGDKETVPQYYVSSGIVLVTGGTASAFTRTILSRINNIDNINSINNSIGGSNILDLQASPSIPSVTSKNNNKTTNNNSNISSTSNINNSNNSNVLMTVQVSDVHDIASPTFCASYAALNKPQSSPLQSTVSLLTRTTSSVSFPGSRGASREVSNNVDATLPPHMLPFCFEVSVGQGAVQTEDGGVFRFLPGFDARTLYLSEQNNKNSSLQEVFDAVPSAAQCELSLLADGRLEIACVSSLPLETSDVAQKRIQPPTKTYFRCRLTVPNFEEEDDQASTQSAESVHVA